MRQRMEYLMDEELNQLIADVEKYDLVAAPPDLAAGILSCLEDDQQKEELIKVKEYRSYCLRVWTSVAAAIVMVFLLPKLMNIQQTNEGIFTKGNLFGQVSIFGELFNGSNIFDQKNSFNLFDEGNGG